MAQQYILSIDQGTTGTTVSVINTKGQLKTKVNREFRQIFPKPGWVEHNPQDIWRSVQKTLKEAMTKANISGQQVAAIGITNQRETVMAWNRETGETLGNAIVWQCRRTADICTKLKKRGAEKRVKQVTGLVLDPYFSGTKMHWILANNSQAKALGRRGQLCFGTVDSFLIWKLTGGEVFATDVSNASRTQTMDLDTLNYSSEMLNLLGLKEEMLPQIQPSGGVFGVTKRVAGLPSGIPIAGVLGDQQSALFGQYCFGSGEAKITYGTGSFLLMNTAQKKIASLNGLLTTVAWHREGEKRPTYALEGGAFICGAAVQYLRDNMGFIGSSSEVENLAKKVGSSEGVQFVPAFAGLGAPFWDPHVRGTLFGLTRGVGKEHLAYATLEAMALQNVDIVNTMIKDSKVSLKTIRVDGGASANNLLMQMQADFQGVNVVRPKVIETTSLGAGLMAGLSVGIWSDLEELKKLDKVDKTFKCQTRLTERNQRLQHWHKAIKAMQIYYN